MKHNNTLQQCVLLLLCFLQFPFEFAALVFLLFFCVKHYARYIERRNVGAFLLL